MHLLIMIVMLILMWGRVRTFQAASLVAESRPSHSARDDGCEEGRHGGDEGRGEEAC